MKRVLVWKSLARGVVLESLRRKDIWVVAILGMLAILSAGSLGFFGFDGLQMFAKDLGLTVLSLFSTIVAVLISSRQLPDEIKNRTLYPLLARPVSRFDFLFGKLIGSILVSWISFALLAVLVAVALSLFGVAFQAILLQYALLKMAGLVIICALSLMLSAQMTPSAATTLSLVLVFSSGMMTRGLTMAALGNREMAWLYTSVAAVVPQLGLFDLSSRAVNEHWSLVPLWAVSVLLGYMAIYGAAMLAISWAKFRRQPL